MTDKTKEVVVQVGQSSVDLALQYYGSLSGMLHIAKLNNFDFISRPEAGTKILVHDITNETLKYVDRYNIVFAGSYGEKLFGGIGYMRVGSTFKVS